MGRPSDVIIGLDVGLAEVRVAAFDPHGREWGHAAQSYRRDRRAPDPLTLDPLEVWHGVVEVIHRLARKVPDLGRRTVALGLTGAPGGLCLIDEDGEPVGPLALAHDVPARAATGPRAGADAAGALLLEAVRERPADADRAAWALDLRGWVLACLSGRPLDPPGLAGSPAGGVGAGWEECERLVPPRVAPDEAMALHPAAAAASGLWDGTPVVAAPPAPLAAGLAAGLADPDLETGLAFLEAETWLVRPVGAAGPARGGWWPEVRALDARPGEIGGSAADWLVGLAQSLLADAGLIGLTRADILALIERQAEAAAPGRVRFERSPAGAPGPWTAHGLGGPSAFPDVARAIHEAIARSCRAGFEQGGGLPPEVRAGGALALAGPGRAILPAFLAVPIRLLKRTAPAATGAAMCALRGVDEIATFTVATGTWIEPFLEPPAPADPSSFDVTPDRRTATPQAGRPPVTSGRRSR